MNIPPKYEDVVAQLEAYRKSYVTRLAYDALQQRLTVAEQRAAVMEKALSRIAREHDCGCSPCTGSCTSQVALEITVDAMRDIAIAALKPAEGEVS